MRSGTSGRPVKLTRRAGITCTLLHNPAQPGGQPISGPAYGGKVARTGIDAVEWAERGAELGVGEILLNSMDADGTKAGFDLLMIRAVRAAVHDR